MEDLSSSPIHEDEPPLTQLKPEEESKLKQKIKESVTKAQLTINSFLRKKGIKADEEFTVLPSVQFIEADELFALNLPSSEQNQLFTMTQIGGRPTHTPISWIMMKLGIVKPSVMLLPGMGPIDATNPALRQVIDSLDQELEAQLAPIEDELNQGLEISMFDTIKQECNEIFEMKLINYFQQRHDPKTKLDELGMICIMRDLYVRMLQTSKEIRKYPKFTHFTNADFTITLMFKKGDGKPVCFDFFFDENRNVMINFKDNEDIDKATATAIATVYGLPLVPVLNGTAGTMDFQVTIYRSNSKSVILGKLQHFCATLNEHCKISIEFLTKYLNHVNELQEDLNMLSKKQLDDLNMKKLDLNDANHRKIVAELLDKNQEQSVVEEIEEQVRSTQLPMDLKGSKRDKGVDVKFQLAENDIHMLGLVAQKFLGVM